MSRCEHLRVLARYNRWMNQRLYALCAELSDAERREDHGAFFRSIHGTLNHLLLADRIWLARFRNDVFPVATALTVMPRVATSRATVLVSPIRPAFAAA